MTDRTANAGPWHIRSLRASEDSLWDEFVRRHPHGSPFHLSAWRRCIAETFGYLPRYLVAESPSGWGAVLPLFEVQGWFSGKAWISTPFAVYGGALIAHPEAKPALANTLQSLAQDAKVQYVDLHNAHDDQRLGFEPVHRYVTFTQPLQPGSQDDLLEVLPKKTRNLVRKALKTSFHFRPASHDWQRFSLFHARTLHRLGTPSFPPAHFRRILDYFGPEAELLEVELDGQLAAASLSFLYGDSAHIYYAGADPAFNHLATNYAMYNHQLLDAARRGFARFDFGRAKLGAGTFEFKKHWATVMHPLPYEMLLVRRTSLPDLTPKNPRFSLAIQLWRRLPFALTRRLGPILIRQFP